MTKIKGFSASLTYCYKTNALNSYTSIVAPSMLHDNLKNHAVPFVEILDQAKKASQGQILQLIF